MIIHGKENDIFDDSCVTERSRITIDRIKQWKICRFIGTGIHEIKIMIARGHDDADALVSDLLQLCNKTGHVGGFSAVGIIPCHDQYVRMPVDHLGDDGVRQALRLGYTRNKGVIRIIIFGIMKIRDDHGLKAFRIRPQGISLQSKHFRILLCG